MKTKRVVHIAVIILLAVSAFAVAAIMCFRASSMEHENVADRFSRGEKFSQITLFIPESAGFTQDKIMYLRYNLEKKLTEKSITPPVEGARIYVDAYSAFRDMTFVSDSSRTANVKAVFTGGDYNLFHKELEYAPDITKDVNHDRVLLSRTAAWQLYGGTELYDFRVTAGEKNYYISGIYDDYTDRQYSEFYGNRIPCVLDMTSEPEMPVTCYELIIVNPVKNFAVNTVTECIDLQEGTYLLVENSERFTIASLVKKIPSIIKPDEQLPVGVNITPEEMIARQAEKELAVLLVVFALFALYPAVWVIILVFKLIFAIKKLINRFIISKIKDMLSYS